MVIQKGLILCTGINDISLVRDSFPGNIARTKKETVELQDMTDRQVKPSSRDALFAWATVVATSSHDPSRSHELVYQVRKTGADPVPSFTRVSIRLYGVLGRHNFTCHGNWSGYAFYYHTGLPSRVYLSP